MLEPVEIDINMNQNVSEEAAKAAAANEEMTKSVDAMQKEIERLNKVVQDMSTALAEQRKIAAASGGELNSTTKKIDGMQAALDKTKQELDAYQVAAEKMNKASKDGADVTEILTDTKKNLAQTEADLVDNAKELVNNQDEINKSQDKSAKSTSANSASNQLLAHTIKKVCDNLGIENTQVQNAIGNVKVIQAVKIGWANAVKILNTNLGISIGLSRAFLITGIGLLVAGIAAAVMVYQNWNKKQEEANRLMLERNKFHADVVNSVQAEISKVQVLEKILKDSNNTYAQRNKALDSLKSIMPEYNALLDKEGRLIEDNTKVLDKYIKKLMDAALAKGAMDKFVAAQNALTQKMADLTPEQQALYKIPQKEIVTNPKYSQKDILGWFAIDDYLNQEKKNVDLWEKEVIKYTKQGIDTVVDDTKAYWEQRQTDALTAMASLTKADKNNKSAAWVAAEKNYRQATEALKTWDIKGQDRADAKAETAAQKKERKLKADGEKLEKMSYDLQKRIDDASVKAIGEGAQREREAAKAEYEQTKALLEQKYKEVAELEKSTGKPATEQRTLLLSFDVEATRQYEAEISRINAQAAKTLSDISTEVNARFANELDSNITKINAYYDELVREATKAGAAIEEVNRLQEARNKEIDRAGVNDKLRKVDLDEALEMEKANNLASIGLATIAEQTKYEIVKKYLKDRINLLRELGDESSNKEADVLETRLKGLQASPKSISGLVNGALFDKIKKGFEKTGDSAEKAQEKTTAIFSSFQKGGAQAVSVINDMKTMFGGLDEGLDKALDAVGNIAQGFATGGIAGGAMAAIGEGLKMFTSYAAVEKEHQEALRQLALAKLEMQREYNLLLLKEQLIYKQGSNIFGADQIRGAVNAINTYRDAIQQLKAELKGDKPELNPLQAIFKGGLDNYKKQLQAYNDGIGALADVDIVTGSRKSGWGFWRKRKDVYSGLLDTYDDVIDKEGKLNTNRIQAILNTHKMSDENKALLESLLELSKGAEEAEQQLKDYLSQTFGGLGDALADSIVTAFNAGTDAAQLFRSNVTDVLSDLAQQMVFTLYLKETFDQLEKDIEKAYSDLADDKLTEEQLSRKVTDILGGFFGGLDGDIEQANKFLEEFWRNAEANGFDRPESQRQGATGVSVAASQDSVNELTGGIYAVRQMLGDIRNDSREELLVQRTIVTMLGVLVERSEHWEHLKELPAVVKKLGDIETYGIPMKVR